jgi:hypothetical protein
MAEILVHPFVSSQAESSNPNLVSKTEWNDGHKFDGGVNGQIITKDNTQTKGARWTDSANLYNSLVTVPNPSTSPYTILSVGTAHNSSHILHITVNLRDITTAGSVTFTADLKIDSVTVQSHLAIASATASRIFTFTVIETETSHTITVVLTSAGAANFTGGTGRIDILTFGI